MQFTMTLPKAQNFTPASLMYKYAKNTPCATFVRDKYFTAYICKSGVWYKYDHLKIEQVTLDTETVTVFLEEIK